MLTPLSYTLSIIFGIMHEYGLSKNTLLLFDSVSHTRTIHQQLDLGPALGLVVFRARCMSIRVPGKGLLPLLHVLHNYHVLKPLDRPMLLCCINREIE